MKNSAFLKKLKEKAEQDNKKRQDLRFRKVMGFLLAKGLLRTNIADIELRPQVKMTIDEILWAAREVEPRILEVLPAVLLKFPGHILLKKNLPTELQEIIDRIRKGEEQGPDFQGVPYAKMKYWTNLRLPDRRTKPQNELKTQKNFRLSPGLVEKLAKLSRDRNLTETEIIEMAVARLK